MRFSATLPVLLSTLVVLARAATVGSRTYAYDISSSYSSDHTLNGTAWQSVNVGGESNKRTSTRHDSLVPRSRKAKTTAVQGAVIHALNQSWNSIKGIGKATDVTITWYTGHDLLNPSCWSSSGWAPTDESFACALTMTGWTTKPKCFSFLELCNGSKKCIFVRVVDTCAGCKVGSKHVDLTKAAFSALSDLDTGVLTVQMRAATEPKEWHTDLWGPRNV